MLTRASLDFVWPIMLWGLLGLPLVMLAYWRLLARRDRHAVRYASLETVGQGARPPGRMLTHVPAALMFLALASLIFALSRPLASMLLPSRIDTVILAMDVSGSMRADDIKPSRLKAAQEAAKAFVADQPSGVRIGIVAVASAAALVQSPTTSREDLEAAIDRIQLQRGTALGSGIVISLATLLPGARLDVEQIISGRPAPSADLFRRPEAEAEKAVTPGSNVSAAIVLLSDGSSNTGPDVIKMAEMAADKGVRIYTIGIGTPEGATLTSDGWSMRVRLDEDVLKNIAVSTQGEYFRAATAKELKRIYALLGTRLALEKQQGVEVSALFAGLGALLAMVAALLSMLWFNRIL